MKTQAEDIIMQKQWQELNVEEKALLQELAENENDFNLLKQMLVVAGEESQVVPVLDRNIENKIKQELFSTRSIRPWLMAAAIIILAIGSWFFFKPSRNIQELPLITREIPPGNSIKTLPADTLEPGSAATSQEIEIAQDHSPATENTVKKSRPSPSRQSISKPYKAPADSVQIAIVSMDVAENPNLLDLVTKLY